MPKVYLSHSSKDKEAFVGIVARQLTKEIGEQNIIYDEMTFEEGMKSAEEINSWLDKTDLFVVFLSVNALNSNWVKRELKKAFYLLTEGNLHRVYPVIIEKSLTHDDERIPEWLKEYNLKSIARPSVVSRRIRTRLREITWSYHPIVKIRENLFVGRNDLIKITEERLDDLDRPFPICIIGAGVPEIGRRSLLRRCLMKSNIISEAYHPPLITLSRHESIEDFILKVHDLGFSEQIDRTGMMTKSISDKVSIAVGLLNDVQNANEILFILDNGCIISPERAMSNWFTSIIDNLSSSLKMTLAFAAKFRISRRLLHGYDSIYYMDIPELEKKERSGLLRRYANEVLKLDLSLDDLKYFSEILAGYPEQVFFAGDLIRDEGLEFAKNHTDLIVDFNSEKVTRLVAKYEKDEKTLDFLRFLSEADFMSFNLIFEVVGEESYYKDLMDDFMSSAICEQLGANNEYLRVNDAVRDYIRRLKLKLTNEYGNKLRSHWEKVLNSYNSDENDVSDLLLSMKMALLEGRAINRRFIIPSHYLMTMRELYDNTKRYRDVVNLADRALNSAAYMDIQIQSELRYFLCMALARLRDERFLSEVQHIREPNHSFLLGFYYRLKGNPAMAIERLNRALAEAPHFSRASGELVRVYIYIEDYGNALPLAKDNYERDKSNPYHIQAYFKCLINQPSSDHKLIENLLNNMDKIKSEKAREMYLTSKAEYLAFCLNEKDEAIDIINTAIRDFPDVPYPKFVKFYICDKYNDITEMENLVRIFETDFERGSYFYNAALSLKAILLAKKGKRDGAYQLLETALRNYPENVVARHKQRLERYFEE